MDYKKQLKHAAPPLRVDFRQTLKERLMHAEQMEYPAASKRSWTWLWATPFVGAAIVVGLYAVNDNTGSPSLGAHEALASAVEQALTVTDEIHFLTVKHTMGDQTDRTDIWMYSQYHRADEYRNGDLAISSQMGVTEFCSHDADVGTQCERVTYTQDDQVLQIPEEPITLGDLQLADTTDGLFLQWHTDQRYTVEHGGYMDIAVSQAGTIQITDAYNSSFDAPDHIRYFDKYLDGVFQHSVQISKESLETLASQHKNFYVQVDVRGLGDPFVRYSPVLLVDFANQSITEVENSIIADLHEQLPEEGAIVDIDFYGFARHALLGTGSLFVDNRDRLGDPIIDEERDVEGNTMRYMQFRLPTGALTQKDLLDQIDVEVEEESWREELPTGADSFAVWIDQHTGKLTQYELLNVEGVVLEHISVEEDQVLQDTDPQNFFTTTQWKKDLGL